MFGADRMVLISDSMAATGLGDGKYVFGGLDITVKDGVARTEGGALAGSTTNLFDCVKKAIEFGIPAEDAFKMASETPATLMGLKKGKIEVGYDSQFIVLDDDYNLVDVLNLKGDCIQ
jgi:N-acetylglucosamine-6-phosphate deacetylase